MSDDIAHRESICYDLSNVSGPYKSKAHNSRRVSSLDVPGIPDSDTPNVECCILVYELRRLTVLISNTSQLLMTRLEQCNYERCRQILILLGIQRERRIDVLNKIGVDGSVIKAGMYKRKANPTLVGLTKLSMNLLMDNDIQKVRRESYSFLTALESFLARE